MRYYLPLFPGSLSPATSELPMRWDLDQIFTVAKAKETGKNLAQQLDLLAKEPSLEKALRLSESLSLELAQLSAYSGCVSADDVTNPDGLSLSSETLSLSLKLQSINTSIDERLAALSDTEFTTLTSQFDSPFALSERREIAQHKLSAREEEIISSLSADGYHNYGELYHSLIGQLRFSLNGEELSLSQIENQVRSADPQVRKPAFLCLKAELAKHEQVFAQILNGLAGFRLQMYQLRGWNDILSEPLWENRMQKQTLEAMWKAINKHKAIFIECMKEKARCLNQDALSFFDLESPLHNHSSSISFDEAAQFIIGRFRTLSPQMAEFAQKALQSRWVEAENRPGKRGGAFCANFPLSQESRIFMTHGGTSYNLMTLAHELGHGFHNWATKDLSGFNQNLKMNVAESASTMAEQIVSQGALENASSDEERLTILDEKISRSFAFFLNLQARFLFEIRFYEERKKGFVLPEKINQLMEEAQRETFGDCLSEPFSQYWIQKLHFYYTEIPFYNFPYTFGYLFSLGIYSRAKADPLSFEKTYIALLEDTGRMRVEDLAEKHLQVDLTQPAFWEEAVEIAVQDAHCYLELLKHSH